jgi:trehalose synthase
VASLPMDDPEENAAIVNALQRRADVVVQKSLAEGFGLTVAEAMWKGRPVVASAVGGIQDQVTDGATGLLVDPRDLDAFGRAVVRLLHDPELAQRLGAAARAHVREAFLEPRHLRQWFEVIQRVSATVAVAG